MTAFLAGIGFGAIVGVPVSYVTTKLLLRRKRLRFPHGIPRAEYCIRCGIPHEPGKCRR